MKFAVLAGLLVLPLSAVAEIEISFRDGAPKDRLTIANTSGCDLGEVSLFFDLSQSKAGLIFDTTASGDGVEVFQPLEVVRGGEYISGMSFPRDGDSSLEIVFADLKEKAEIVFTLDLDDTRADNQSGQIIVRGDEIMGATVKARSSSDIGVFDASGVARIKMDCG